MLLDFFKLIFQAYTQISLRFYLEICLIHGLLGFLKSNYLFQRVKDNCLKLSFRIIKLLKVL